MNRAARLLAGLMVLSAPSPAWAGDASAERFPAGPSPAGLSSPVAGSQPTISQDTDAQQDSAQDSAAGLPRDTSEQATTPFPPGIPVMLRGDTILLIRTRVGAYSAAERAEAIRQRLEAITRQPSAETDSIRLAPDAAQTDLLVGDRLVLTITDADAAAERTDRAELAERWRTSVAAGLERHSFLWLVRSIAIGLFGVLVLVALVYWVFRLVNGWLFPRATEWVEANRGTRIPTLKLQRLELLSAERVAELLLGALEVARLVALGLLLLFALPAALGLFPWTQELARRLVGYVMDPATTGWRGLVNYLPKLFTIVVVIVATYYALRVIALGFRGLGSGTVRIRGFHRDWATPTYKIVRFLVIVLAAILIWPYLPSSDSPAFKGIAAFLGLLLSFGSAGAVANVVGGMVIIYMRPFKEGDRVKIADTVGDVRESNLLVTRVRTVKNVDVTIPNAMILSSHIVNFSSSARRHGLILHDAVTIGYDAPWRSVHELLIGAARATDDVEAEPAPFVLQTALDDFYVRYEINAYTKAPNRMVAILSELRANIQDAFNDAGMEIMSPHYNAARDGSRTAIPDDYLPSGYEPPPFRFAGLWRKTEDGGGSE